MWSIGQVQGDTITLLAKRQKWKTCCKLNYAMTCFKQKIYFPKISVLIYLGYFVFARLLSKIQQQHFIVVSFGLCIFYLALPFLSTKMLRHVLVLTNISIFSWRFLQEAANVSEVAYSKYQSLFFMRLLNLWGFFSRSKWNLTQIAASY